MRRAAPPVPASCASVRPRRCTGRNSTSGALDPHGVGTAVGAVDEADGVVVVMWARRDRALVLLVLQVTLGAGLTRVEDVDEVAERVSDGAEALPAPRSVEGPLHADDG